MDAPDLQALNRYSQHRCPAVHHVVAWADEGRPYWDCKGGSACTIADLERAGVSPSDIKVLIVPGAPAHMVVDVRLDGQDYVLDSASPWLERPSDYQILATVPAFALQAWIPQARQFDVRP